MTAQQLHVLCQQLRLCFVGSYLLILCACVLPCCCVAVCVQESVATTVLVFIMFQCPMLVWMIRRRQRVMGPQIA